ncbi:11296_t:CDS:2 [Dentiscutata erythropus]|uniref:11296_t:CDS:1 n=1 Tax=Dentiscutata erythropus TaxID=1348616 RepID=A0A9N8YSG9_9GLOM|nr:11296_t:CDS:2 [Dentiscutata erythropus]
MPSYRSFSNLSFLALFLVILSIVSAETINVAVGGDSLIFSPQNITVNKGDMVQFNWTGGQHSIIRSDGQGSCTPSTSLKSGNATISDARTSGMVIFTIDGSDSKIWYYCGVGNHCKMGMWGVITLAGSDNSGTKANTSSTSAKSSSTRLGISGTVNGIIPDIRVSINCEL